MGLTGKTSGSPLPETVLPPPTASLPIKLLLPDIKIPMELFNLAFPSIVVPMWLPITCVPFAAIKLSPLPLFCSIFGALLVPLPDKRFATTKLKSESKIFKPEISLPLSINPVESVPSELNSMTLN